MVVCYTCQRGQRGCWDGSAPFQSSWAGCPGICVSAPVSCHGCLCLCHRVTLPVLPLPEGATSRKLGTEEVTQKWKKWFSHRPLFPIGDVESMCVRLGIAGKSLRVRLGMVVIPVRRWTDFQRVRR